MSLQEICEVGGDIGWMSRRVVMSSFSSSPTTPSSPSPQSPSSSITSPGSANHITGSISHPAGFINSSSGSLNYNLNTSGSMNNITNTTTTLRPLPDTGHCVQQLRALLPSRPDIGFLRTDDEFLIRFLKVRNFQVASAFQLLCGYYCYRQRERDLFKTTVGGAGVRAALEEGVVGVLAERDACGSAVLVVLASNCDDTKVGLADIWGATLLSLERLCTRGEEAGVVAVIDWSDCPPRLNNELTPKSLRLVLDGLQDAFPLRVAGVHLLNAPWWSSAALRLARPFIKEKTRARIHVHGNNLSSLHKHLPPRLLPAQLGGEGGEYHAAAWTAAVLDGCLRRANTPTDEGGSSHLLNSTALKDVSQLQGLKDLKDLKELTVVKDVSKDLNIKGKGTRVRKMSDGSGSKDDTVDDKDTCSKDDYQSDEETDNSEERLEHQSKGFTFENLIKSGSRKFHLAQMMEDSEGFTLKKIKASSVDYYSKTPNNKETGIFSFSKSKSISIDDTNYDDWKDSENVYSFPKPTRTSPSFTTSLTSSLTTNISRMGFNIRSKDGLTSYERGQPSSHMLLPGDMATPT